LVIYSTDLCQCRIGLGQPEGHVHSTVQVNGRGQGGTGLFGTTSLVIKLAKAEVAVRHQWAHAQLPGQSQGLLVVDFGLCGIGRVGVGLHQPFH
jgi:hypothetical protein